MKNNKIKKISKYIIVFILLISIFVSLLILTSSFPSEWIMDNVRESSNLLLKEGNRKIYFAFEQLEYREMDNYSDALMINTAYSIDNKTPLYSAFVARKDYIRDVTKIENEDVIGELSYSSKYENHDEVSELRDLLNGEAEESFEYAKYWHGYLIFLRPILLIFNYLQIRILLIILFSILAIIFLIEISKKLNKSFAFIFGFGLISVEYFYVGLSLLNSSMFMIMMISSIIIIKKYDKINDFSLVFFMIGIFVGFFGLLDIPLITLGVPLILYTLLKDKYDSVLVKQQIIDIIKLSILWVIGYSLVWFTKWILIDLIFNKGIIKKAFSQILYRTVGLSIPYSQVLAINLIYVSLPMIILIFVLVFLIFKFKIMKIHFEYIKKSLPYFIIGLIPFAWYRVLTNHSYLHCFFTYKDLLITLISFPIGVYFLCNGEKLFKNEELNIKK